jgi:hypothetical protein
LKFFDLFGKIADMLGKEFPQSDIGVPDSGLQSEAKQSVLQLPELRVSCACQSRIIDEQGRYLLLVNRNRKRGGQIILTPIGGGLEVAESGRIELETLAGITAADYERGNDLRFTIQGKNVNILREWFLARRNREIDSIRETTEELVDESQALEASDLQATDSLQSFFAGFFSELAITTKSGREGMLTLRLLEIYDVYPSSSVLSKLKVAEKSSSELALRFVSQEEIMAGKTIDGIEIGTVSQSLLNPRETISEFI